MDDSRECSARGVVPSTPDDEAVGLTIRCAVLCSAVSKRLPVVDKGRGLCISQSTVEQSENSRER